MSDPLSIENQVVDQAGCIEVIAALARHYDNSKAEWQNQTIPQYLDGMAAWIRDADLGRVESSAWGFLADALRAARVYE